MNLMIRREANVVASEGEEGTERGRMKAHEHEEDPDLRGEETHRLNIRQVVDRSEAPNRPPTALLLKYFLLPRCVCLLWG